MCADWKQMLFVLVIVECIKTDAARCQIFALQIDGPFTLTVARHFLSLNTKCPRFYDYHITSVTVPLSKP